MADETPNYGFETLALHGGQQPDPTTNSRAVPLYQTSSYVFNSTEHAANLFGLKEFGNIYTRIMNPTQAVFEERVALLEGGVAALALSSGQAAETLAILNIAGAGDEIVSTTSLYGGTYNLFAYTLPKLGITVKFVEPTADAVKAAITDKTKAVYSETIGNPNLVTLDIAAVAEVAHASGVPLIIDNTFASPYLVNPIKHGADIVIHSATKFIGGHGTSIGGIVVDGGTFDWAASGRFPDFTTPDESYHGLVHAEAFGPLAFILKLRVQGLRDIGPAISPFNAWLLSKSLETLAVRMERHASNALTLARHFEGNPEVERVRYPFLPSHPQYDLAVKQMSAGGGILVLELHGGLERARRFLDSVELLSHSSNLGDARSIVTHPASTTHSKLTEEERATVGIVPGMVRISVGLEHPDDLVADIEQALARSA
jgi:O-acetylhomoserine (thiol)-lyase